MWAACWRYSLLDSASSGGAAALIHNPSTPSPVPFVVIPDAPRTTGKMEKPSRLSATSPRSWHRTSRRATPTNSTTVNSSTGRRRRTPDPYLGPSLQRHRVSNKVGPPKRVSAGCCAGRTALGMGRTPPLPRRRTRGWCTAHHQHPGQASLVPHGAPAALLHRQPLQAVPYRNRRTPPVQLPRSEIP